MSYPDALPEHSLSQSRSRLALLFESGRKLFLQIAAEMRRLNRTGAEQRSREERVRAVKQALARRGEGPNRCC
jgi:hypothetical protein